MWLNAGDTGDALQSLGWLGRSSGVGNSNPLQYSCLDNPTDRRASLASVHGVAEESDMTEWLSTSIHPKISFGKMPTSSNVGFQSLFSQSKDSWGSWVTPTLPGRWKQGPLTSGTQWEVWREGAACGRGVGSLQPPDSSPLGCFFAWGQLILFFFPRILGFVPWLWFLLHPPVSWDQGFLPSLAPKPWDRP